MGRRLLLSVYHYVRQFATATAYEYAIAPIRNETENESIANNVNESQKIQQQQTELSATENKEGI